MTAPRRRLSFGLRTMLLVVAALSVALWVGYQLNWIRMRHELLASPHIDSGSVIVRPPGCLWVFGERGYGLMSVDFDDDIPRMQTLFPEAFAVGIRVHGLEEWLPEPIGKGAASGRPAQ